MGWSGLGWDRAGTIRAQSAGRRGPLYWVFTSMASYHLAALP
jgi:hypothetical protein